MFANIRVLRGLRFYLTKHHLDIIGIILGLLGTVLSYVFYAISVSSPEVIFICDPIQTTIVDSRKLSDAPIHIARSDGSRIVNDVNAVTFYLWNRGRGPIRHEDVLDTFVIALEDRAAEILACQITGYSRPPVRPVIERTVGATGDQYSLTFQILEHNDGIVGQVLYVAKAPTNAKILGSAVGMKRIMTSDDLQGPAARGALGRRLLNDALVIVGVLTFSWIAGYSTKSDRARSPRAKKVMRFGRIVVIGIVIGYLAVAILNAVVDSERNALMDMTKGASAMSAVRPPME